MLVTMDLSPEQEAPLTAEAQQRGVSVAELARQLLTEQLSAVVRTATGPSPRSMSPLEVIRALDELAEMNRGRPVLPPEAFERESIYQDLP
jgi:hypothetical protein